jgi:elongation factor P
MDLASYEQIHVPGGIMGDAAKYLTEGGEAQVSLHKGVPISVGLPSSMVLRVKKTDPAVKGDTRTSALKRATLETGVVVSVPLFVEEGELVKVDTRSGDYIERVKS